MSENLICERCGSIVDCNREQVNNCFCNAVRVSKETLKLLQTVYNGCLCRGCLEKVNSLVGISKKYPHYQEGSKLNLHYYMENDFFVFTEIYHIQKGYCCGNTCRHCPYYKC